MAPVIIQKLKRKPKAKDKIKVKVKDAENNEVTEYLPICTAEDPLEFAIDSILQALTIERRYDLHSEGKTKFLVQSIGRAFEGRVSDKFEEAKQGVRFDAQNNNANRTRFETMIRAFMAKLFPEDALEDQKEYLESARCPGDISPENYIERIMHINKCLLWYEVGATNYSNKELIRKIIARNLPGQIRIEFISKGGDRETDLDKVKSLINTCSKTVAVRKEYDEFKKSKNKDKSSKKKGDQSSGKEKSDKPNSKPNPCRKHNGEHEWKDCPDNRKNQKSNKSKDDKQSKDDTKKKKNKKGEENYSTERTSTPSKKASFQKVDCGIIDSEDDYDEDSSVGSAENFMIETLKPSATEDAHPEVIVSIPIKPGKPGMYAARGLLDMCCTGVIAKKSFAEELIRSGTYHLTPAEPTTWTTSNGKFKTTHEIKIKKAMLPSLSTKRTFPLTMSVLPEDYGNYDVIIGKDTMKSLGINANIVDGIFTWNELAIPMVSKGHWTESAINAFIVHHFSKPATDVASPDEIAAPANDDNANDKAIRSALRPYRKENHAPKSLGEKAITRSNSKEVHSTEKGALKRLTYEAADLPAIVAGLPNLNAEQKQQLLTVFRKHEAIFAGKRGNWKGEEVSIRLKEGAKPYYARPYPIPLKHLDATKHELERQSDIGALRRLTGKECEVNKWAFPAFGVPKKNTGEIRLVIDFRKLNEMIERCEFPLPTIEDTLQQLGGFTYATGIDFNMGYLSLPLCAESKKILRIIMPFGLFECQVLPMGVKPATDIFQSRIVNLFAPMKDQAPISYLDDNLHVKGKNFTEHLSILDEVLTRIEDAKLQVNAKKSTWCATKLEFLGFMLYPDGYAPLPKRVEAILAISRPKNIKELRHFLGCINFIKNHIPRRAEIIAPLTLLTKKDIPFKWTAQQEEAFTKVKAAVSESIMLSYPDVNKPFVIYTDASEYALGGIVTQEGKTISCFSRKLTPAQQRYTTTDQELLAIDETLKHHHNIIYGCDIIVKTDHKNLTHSDTKHTSQRVLRQRISIDQVYQAKLEYYEGTLNEGADGLSRLPMTETSKTQAQEELYLLETMTDRTFNEMFPLDLRIISREQSTDAELDVIKNKHPSQIGTKELEGHKLCTVKGLIWVPLSLRHQLLEWYHTNLGHAGSTRMLKTINVHFNFKGIRKAVEETVKHCEECQRYKIMGKNKYGHIPLTPALRDKEPWEVIHLDCTGPWTIKFQNEITDEVFEKDINLLTMIDACTGWVEFAPMLNKTAIHTAKLFDKYWLCRYPRPRIAIFDNGTEFIGTHFQEMLASYNIQPRPTTVKNPQANAIIERIHAPLADQLRCTTFKGTDWISDLDTIIQACAFALRATVPSNAPYSPAQMAFGVDMFFRQKTIIDWEKLKQLRKQQAEHNNIRENKKRTIHTYHVGDQILLVTPVNERRNQRKLSSPTEGPYVITKVYQNGTIKIIRNNFEEIVSIRRVRPFYQ